MRCDACTEQHGRITSFFRCDRNAKYKVEGTRQGEKRDLFLCGVHKRVADRGRGVAIFAGNRKYGMGDDIVIYETPKSADNEHKERLENAVRAEDIARHNLMWFYRTNGEDAVKLLERLSDPERVFNKDEVQEEIADLLARQAEAVMKMKLATQKRMKVEDEIR
jgi:hypothetical protein